MTINFHKLEKKSVNEYIYTINENVIVVKYLIPFGHTSKELPPGYAHLIEHMYISSNYEYLKELEKKGVRFNATTTENSIEITLIDPTGDILNDSIKNNKKENLLYSVFTEKELELEKKVILNEYNILEKTMGEKEVESMIGSKNNIEMFCLDKLNKYHRLITPKFIKISFMPSLTNNFKNNNENFKKENSWVSDIHILKMEKDKDKTILLLEDNYSSRILFYSLRIFFDQILGLGYPYYNIKGENFEVILPVKYDLFKEYIYKYKINSLKRYKLKTALSFKFLSDEVLNFIKLMNLYFDDYDIQDEKFYLENWENAIEECTNE